MKPTQAKSLTKKTAEKLNIDQDMVSDIVDFYYSVVVRKMESLEYPTLLLHGFGTLRLSRVKLERDIRGLKKLLASNNQEDFKKVVKYNLNKELLEKKEKALETCNEYYRKKYEKRYQNMEKPQPDNGGNQE